MGRSGDTVEELVGRLRAGDASESVLRMADRVLRRAEPVAALACRLEARGLPEELVADLVQDTLEVVWRRLEEFEHEGRPFEAWVRGIARNLCANARRRKRDLLTEDGVLDPADPACGALRAMQRHERHELLAQAIEAALEPVEQDVVYHRYVHQLERDRIAELVGLADADEVRVILQRATRRLGAELRRRMDDLGLGPSFVRSG